MRLSRLISNGRLYKNALRNNLQTNKQTKNLKSLINIYCKYMYISWSFFRLSSLYIAGGFCEDSSRPIRIANSSRHTWEVLTIHSTYCFHRSQLDLNRSKLIRTKLQEKFQKIELVPLCSIHPVKYQVTTLTSEIRGNTAHTSESTQYPAALCCRTDI